MINKYKKGAFVITLVLFIILVLLTISGLILHKLQAEMENPNHEFHLNNKLYFYNSKDSLIGTYTCAFDNCDYAIQMVADDEYGINYYHSEDNYTSMIQNQYAFIGDYKNQQSSVYLYDIKNEQVLATYKTVKNYGIGLVGDYYIVETLAGTYGVIKIENNEIKTVISFTYDFIGLQEDIDVDQNKIFTDIFIVKKGNSWYLIDNNEAEFTARVDSTIVAYDAQTIITKDDYYHLYNYNGTLYLNSNYKQLEYYSNYLKVQDLNNNVYLMDIGTSQIVSNTYILEDFSKFEINQTDDNSLQILIDGEAKETIEISQGIVYDNE